MERTIKLLTNDFHFFPKTEERLSRYLLPRLDREVEPTGRWKVLTINGESTLYLECFKWIEKDVIESVIETKTTHHVFGSKTISNWVDLVVGKKLSVKNLGWISEYDLGLKIIDREEFINTCGESYEA